MYILIRAGNTLSWVCFGLVQIFCARPKIYWHIVTVTNILGQTKKWFAFSKFFLCRHKSFWRGTKCSQIFGLTQKIWTSTKHFATCKRTRHKSSKRWVGGPKKVKNMMTQYLNGHLEFGQNSRIRRHQLKIIDYRSNHLLLRLFVLKFQTF